MLGLVRVLIVGSADLRELKNGQTGLFNNNLVCPVPFISIRSGTYGL